MSNRIGSVTRLYLSPPQDAGATWEPEGGMVSFEGDLNSPTTLQATFNTRWDVIQSESDPANPLQLKAHVQLDRFGNNEWRGLVFSREVLAENGGVYTVRIKALDMTAWLRKLAAVWTLSGRNEYEFTLMTPPLVQTGVDLFQLPAIGDAQWVYAPEWPGVADPPDSSMWLPNASVNTVKITQIIDGSFVDGDSIRGPLVTTAGASAMLPGGAIRITTGGLTEWFYYDGYIQRIDGYWWFNNVTRAMFGTSAHDHAANDDAYQCISKQVSPVGVVELTGTNGAGATVIEDKNYTLNPDDGYVYFNGNPALLSADDSDPYTSFDLVEYSVFDETNTDPFPDGRLTLSYLFAQFLEAAVAAGGPGWTTADYQINISPDLVLSRVHVDDSEFLLDLQERILNEIGLRKGSTTDAIGIFDGRHPSDRTKRKVHYDSISQKDADSADYVFDSANAVASDLSLENIKGSILVKYESAQARNLASAARTWFSEVTGGSGFKDTSIGSLNKEPNRQSVTPASGTDPSWSSPAAGISNLNHQGAQLMFDGDDNSGYGLAWSLANNPGTDCEIFYCHFSDTLNENFHVKRIKINYDIADSSDSTNQASIRVYGLRGFVPGTTSAKPTYTSRIDLSSALRQKYSIGDTTSFKNAILDSGDGNDIGVDCEAIVIVWDGLPVVGATYREARIREILVEGPTNLYELVQITDDPLTNNDSTYIYAPVTYDKIYDDKTGLGLMDKISVGVASRNVAISFGRLALLQGLVLGQIRDYEVNSEFARIPDFGDTIRMMPNTPDEFTGVLIAKSYECMGDEKLTLSLVDFRSELFGT